jgi:hypothetical protein
MYSLLPIIMFLAPLALAFPKEDPKHHSRHHDDGFPTSISSYTSTSTITVTKTSDDSTTSFPTLTVSTLPSTDIFPTGTGLTGSGTIFSFPTAFSTGDFKIRKRRDLAVLQGRKWTGAGSGTTGCSKPKETGKGKHHDDDGGDDDSD